MDTKLVDVLNHALSNATLMQSEAPWRLVIQTSSGGAFAAGIDGSNDELLVVSANGQAVFDTATGSRIYRNREEAGYDREKLEARRMDKPGESPIRMAGDDGGGLRQATSDGWTIDNLQINWLTSYSILQQPGASIYFLGSPWDRLGKDASFRVLVKSESLPIAFGFSGSGKSLIWLDRSDLFIWNRHT